MKRSLSVLTGFSLTTMIFISCQRNTLPPSPSSQIVGKWTMKEAIVNYTDEGVNHSDTARFTSADYFDFRADSTLIIVATGSTYNGKWQITNNKLFITETNYFDFRPGLDLPVLTATELQLYDTITTPNLEQKLNLYR